MFRINGTMKTNNKNSIHIIIILYITISHQYNELITFAVIVIRCHT